MLTNSGWKVAAQQLILNVFLEFSCVSALVVAVDIQTPASICVIAFGSFLASPEDTFLAQIIKLHLKDHSFPFPS